MELTLEIDLWAACLAFVQSCYVPIIHNIHPGKSSLVNCLIQFFVYVVKLIVEDKVFITLKKNSSDALSFPKPVLHILSNLFVLLH